MNNSIVISSANDIDLDRHGVIEAHAGTGKTYTIVNLALRMLERPAGADDGRFIHLRDIMLVTYTEKAAGELKKRIQEGIAPRIRELAASGDARLAAHLENCLNNMHEALIGTIHSVCLRLLQTWPFETGVHFSTQIADDDEGVRTLLRESMRTDWQDETTGIPQVLRLLEERGVSLRENKHLKLIQISALALLNGDVMAEDDTAGGESPVYMLIRRASAALAKRYGDYKRKNGLVSYNDMLRLTHEAVHANNSVMLKTLRDRLRYGIIDEFQDTSPLQWDIFKKIFIADTVSPNTRPLYIVGDPKQSIYSFQNADVRSYIAAKSVIAGLGGPVYSLIANYRSLPEMIDGYNTILGGGSAHFVADTLSPSTTVLPAPKDSQDNTVSTIKGACAPDWFLFDDGGIAYPPDQHARPPKREKNARPLPYSAIQVIAANDGAAAAENRTTAAIAAAAAITKLRGTTISIPKGLDYEEITLDYRDFAVIVESHSMADPFIEAFRASGIPCVKYKLRGVFMSALARDMLAVLRAVHKRHSRSRLAAALLTHFFNRPPETIDPSADLLPCGDSRCGGDDLCAAHAFDHWGKLADRQLWAQLIESVVKRTGIRQRLIRLTDGERKLADLRQVADYCIEYLYHQSSNLGHLTDHLERLYNDEEQAGQDKNIHTLATEKSSVSILTMHASKGLEFPVVFMMSRTAVKLPSGPNILPWGHAPRFFIPYISAAADKDRIAKVAEAYKLDQQRERRRLLYVAMTRAQAMLFIVNTGHIPFIVDTLSQRTTVLPITGTHPIVVDIPNPSTTVPSTTNERRCNTVSTTKWTRPLIVRETSYSQLSRAAGSHYRIDTDSESADADLSVESKDDEYHAEERPQTLKGGRRTGDALHKAMEEILLADHISAVINDGECLNGITGKYLLRGGILDGLSDNERTAAIEQASSYIHSALTTPYPIPGIDDPVVIADLKKSDRMPELEFLLSCKPHRIRGFMDLVFRVGARYYIADWKSDTLDSYDRGSIEQYCREKNYLLQAQIYSLALDRFLRGILGRRYDRKINLGGAAYVFMRGGKNAFWYHPADPSADIILL